MDRFAHTLLCGLMMSGQALAQPASSGTLLCSGALTRSQGIEWDKQTIEFSLPYSHGAVVTPKTDVEALSVPLRIELDDTFLKAAEAQVRMPSPEGNLLRITQFQVSRQTGRFGIQATLVRDSGALIGASAWEGSCERKGEEPLKF